MNCEVKGSAAVAWIKGSKHRFYEDRYRLLPKEVPLVGRQDRGEIFAVFDGIGSAPEGRSSAQEMCDWLLKLYQEPEAYSANFEGIHQLLKEANLAIYNWGFMEGTDRPLGGCAGTVVWIYGDTCFTFHAGDTVALLIRDGEASQLTRLHEMDGAIYRYFGLGENLEIDIDQFPIEEFDRILILSDGVTKAFHPIEAADIVEEYDDICRAAKELARLSQTRGSADDITVLLLEIEE